MERAEIYKIIEDMRNNYKVEPNAPDVRNIVCTIVNDYADKIEKSLDEFWNMAYNEGWDDRCCNG